MNSLTVCQQIIDKTREEEPPIGYLSPNDVISIKQVIKDEIVLLDKIITSPIPKKDYLDPKKVKDQLFNYLLINFNLHNIDKQGLRLNFNDELFRLCCYYIYVSKHSIYYSKYIITWTNRDSNTVYYYQPLIETYFKLSLLMIQHKPLLYLKNQDPDSVCLSPPSTSASIVVDENVLLKNRTTWPSEESMRSLWIQISTILVSYFYNGPEFLLEEMMYPVEEKLQKEDELIYEQEEMKRLQSKVNIDDIDVNDDRYILLMNEDRMEQKRNQDIEEDKRRKNIAYNNPIYSVIEQKSDQKRNYVKNWPFLPIANHYKDIRLELCYHNTHDQSGVLFNYSANNLCYSFLSNATHFYTQYYIESKTIKQYDDKDILYTSSDLRQYHSNIHRWLLEEYKTEQTSSVIDLINHLLFEYHLPIGSRSYSTRSFTALEDEQQPQTIMNNFVGSHVANHIQNIISDDRHIHYFLNNYNEDHILYNYILLAKMNQYFETKFPQAISDAYESVLLDNPFSSSTEYEIEEDTDEHPDGTTLRLQKLKGSFIDRYIIQYSKLLSNQGVLEQTHEYEALETYKLRNNIINNEDIKDVHNRSTAIRLPYMIYLQQKWYVHYQSKWVGIYNNVMDALLCWMLIIKEDYAWRLPDRTYLKPAYELWFMI